MNESSEGRVRPHRQLKGELSGCPGETNTNSQLTSQVIPSFVHSPSVKSRTLIFNATMLSMHIYINKDGMMMMRTSLHHIDCYTVDLALSLEV